MLVSLDELYPVMESYLSQGKEVTFTVTGRSMAPLLRHGRDQVVLKKPAGGLKPGDLPLYRRADGRFILHRVIAVKDGVYTMCGDGQTALEEGVTDESILAVAIGFVRRGRKLPVSSPLYRVYVGFWLGARPVRRYFLALLRRLNPDAFVIDRKQ